MKIIDYKAGIIEFIDKWQEEPNEDKKEDYLFEAISLAHRLADFDHRYMGLGLGELYKKLKGELHG